MEWMVELRGDSTDLEILSEALKDDELIIEGQDKQYVLKSSKFEKIGDSQGVRELAENLLLVVNALGKLYFDAEGSISPGAVYRRDKNGTASVAVFPERVVLRDKVHTATVKTTQKGQEIESLVAQSVKDLWGTVYKNDALFKAVRLFLKEGSTWYGIYKIVNDIILKEKPDIVNLRWVSQNKIDRLKHTSNCYATVGDEARHATRMQPPKNPMSILEARDIMQNLLKKWIEDEQNKRP